MPSERCELTTTWKQPSSNGRCRMSAVWSSTRWIDRVPNSRVRAVC